MYRFNAVLLALTLGCASPPQPLPIHIDAARSKAYVSRDQLSIYLVSMSEALTVTLNLAPGASPQVRAAVGKEHSIVRLLGPDVGQYVLPGGGATPPTPVEGYTQTRAIAGFIICKNPPTRGSFPYGTEIVVSLEGVDFGGGGTFSLEPIRLTVRPFPP